MADNQNNPNPTKEQLISAIAHLLSSVDPSSLIAQLGINPSPPPQKNPLSPSQNLILPPHNILPSPINQETTMIIPKIETLNSDIVHKVELQKSESTSTHTSSKATVNTPSHSSLPRKLR